MTLSIYMDHHVPAAVTDGLRRRGVVVLTAHEDGAARLDDDLLLERASGTGYVVFTEGADFLEIAHRWQRTGREFAGVVYAHQLHVTVGQVIRDLELIAKVLGADEIRNQVVFLPLS